MTTIRNGSRGTEVKILQCFVGVTPDGIYGKNTEKAVKEAQKTYGLVVDGVCGSKTWEALYKTRPTVRMGVRNSNEVRALQLLLSIPADGIFGQQTYDAVRIYQMQYELGADGVCGPITWASLHKTGIANPGAGDVTQPVDYKQYDSRWGSKMYSNHGDKSQTIKSSGCGPTALADIVASWFDSDFTPVQACDLAVQWGCRTNNDGTAHSFFAQSAQHWPFSGYRTTTTTTEAIEAIKAGCLVVALMGKGYWTNGGHYICLWKYDPVKDELYANDPASPDRKKASAKIFRDQSKRYFIYER